MEVTLVNLRALLDDLTAQFGQLHDWWAAGSRFEIMIGAVLVQRTRWENAAMSLARLRTAGLLDDPRTLAATERESIAALIQPSGFAQNKSRACQAVAEWVTRLPPTSDLDMGSSMSAGAAADGGFADSAAQQLLRPPLDRTRPSASAPLLPQIDDQSLRSSLLGVFGVGPETADAQLLFAFDRPVFIADAYAHRVFASRELPSPVGYEPMRALVQPWLLEAELDVAEAQRLHAVIVEAGSALR